MCVCVCVCVCVCACEHICVCMCVCVRVCVGTRVHVIKPIQNPVFDNVAFTRTHLPPHTQCCPHHYSHSVHISGQSGETDHQLVVHLKYLLEVGGERFAA